MCYRVQPLRLPQLQMALDLYRKTGHARVKPAPDPPKDAYPGSKLPLIAPGDEQQLVAVEDTWGFPSPKQPSRRIFNTRLDTALKEQRGDYGMWADPISQGRCLIPVRSFYEAWTRPSKERPSAHSQVQFSLAGFKFFLLAGIRQDGLCSIITTTPNAAVNQFHNRMPLVLDPGESSIWLGPNFADLADRSGINLTYAVEKE